MKRTFFALFLLLGLSLIITFAQAPLGRSRGSRPQIPTTQEGIDSAAVDRAGVLRNHLALSDTQTLAIVLILRLGYTERERIVNDSKTGTPQDRTALGEIMAKTEKEIIGQLTDDQKVKYEEFKIESRRGSGAPRTGGTGTSGGGRRN